VPMNLRSRALPLSPIRFPSVDDDFLFFRTGPPPITHSRPFGRRDCCRVGNFSKLSNAALILVLTPFKFYATSELANLDWHLLREPSQAVFVAQLKLLLSTKAPERDPAAFCSKIVQFSRALSCRSSESVLDHHSAIRTSLTRAAKPPTPTFPPKSSTTRRPAIKGPVMESGRKSSKRSHTSNSRKGDPSKPKKTGSRDKKASSTGNMGGSENKTKSGKGLQQPADVKPGPEGDVSQRIRIYDSLS
jgi:hypothetical protein